MPLSDAEIRFVDWVKGKKIDVAAVTDSAERQQKKEAFLTGTLAVNLDKARGEIDAAQGLIIQKTDDPNLLVGAWRKMTKTEDAGRSEMKWRATDDDVNQGIFDSNQLRADVEVDTTADIDANTDLIDIGAIQALQQSFERIKEMERAMRSELDKNGEPVFTDADIRRELWTPLVRSGLIPENMVPNEFSEQAIAFKGAKDLYEDKLQEHTASTSAEQENLKIGLRIAKEVVKVAGSIVSNSITIANAPQIASLKSETANLAKVDPQTDAITKQISDLKDNVARLEAMATHAETATTLAAGAISGIEMIADHKAAPKDQPPIDKWLNTISKGVELAQKMSVACVGSAFVSGSDGGRNSTDLAKCVTGAMNAGFTAGRLVPSLALIVREPDETKRAKLIAGAVNDFASAAESSRRMIAAFSM
ncbi:hypothetical protein [Aphanothece microscopica]|uniref:hypothetical protein n=1 Tax=Aphanothece microscopica TaxID=1049561 RepID=UPI003984D1F2